MSKYVITDKTEVARRHEAMRKRTIRNKAIERNVLQRCVEGTDAMSENESPFVWLVYGLSTRLFETLKGSHVTMLTYLSTFCDYDGHIMFKRRNASKKDLAEILGVSERETRSFWKAVSEAGICTEEGDVLCMNRSYFRRGSVSPSEIKAMAGNKMYLTRLYIDAVRSLYRSAETRSYKTLAYLFQVMPFVSRQYSIVCHNPLEETLNRVQPMTLGQFCDAIGYDPSNTTRLFNVLFEPTFLVNGRQESAIRYVINKKRSDRRSYQIFINPSIYYAGSRWDEVKVLGQF